MFCLNAVFSFLGNFTFDAFVYSLSFFFVHFSLDLNTSIRCYSIHSKHFNGKIELWLIRTPKIDKLAFSSKFVFDLMKLKNHHHWRDKLSFCIASFHFDIRFFIAVFFSLTYKSDVSVHLYTCTLDIILIAVFNPTGFSLATIKLWFFFYSKIKHIFKYMSDCVYSKYVWISYTYIYNTHFIQDWVRSYLFFTTTIP